MAKKKTPEEPPLQPRIFRSTDEIDRAIEKLSRRIAEVAELDVTEAYRTRSGAEDVVESDIRESIRDVFGSDSPENREHRYIRIWSGPMWMNMPPGEIVKGMEAGKTFVTNILQGLIKRLKEKRLEFESEGAIRSAESIFGDLQLHPRIRAVSERLFRDGHHWEAVFNAAKALVNLVKEKAGRYDLDGAPLVRSVFSRNNPTLAFNDLKDQTDLDEQEGMMHLFEGAVLAIRNPGGHAFPGGPPQRALEYLELLSLLAYRTDEAKPRPLRPF